MKPEFATNRDDEKVADAIRGHLSWLLKTRAVDFEVAISTAYFNPRGFELLARELERVARIRLLLGTEPDSFGQKRRQLDSKTPPEKAARAKLRNALAGHRRTIEEDRDLLGFTPEVDRSAKRLVEWLRSGRVEVRRFENGFLHGKAFLVTTDAEGVIAGSSNFTYGGLASNRELNLGHYQPHVVSEVATWFDELWEQSETFDLAAIYDARFLPHQPYTIYLRMLFERYGQELLEEAKAQGTTDIHLTQFQNDGVLRAKRILAERHGVLVADGVGLGKTFIAGELIREAVQERRQRVLLVAPAALRDGPWKKFLLKHGLGVESISYEQLSGHSDLNPKAKTTTLSFDLDDYAMVVIDEAHAYRNPDTQRAEVLRRLLRGAPAKHLVLVTATPVNNSLMDLYYLLGYFVRNDAAFADVGILSLRAHFGEAMAVDPDDLSPDRLFDVLDALAVRRTRHFVKRYYPHDRIEIDGMQVPIVFPKPHVHKVAYDLEAVLPGFFDHFAHALDCGEGDCDHAPEIGELPTLTLARYTPSRYRLSGKVESYEVQLAGLLRSGLLKRFESSAHAFARTCERMAATHDAFLDLLDKGYVAEGAVLGEWIATDSDEIEDLIDQEIGAGFEPAEQYDVERLRRDAAADQRLLQDFAAAARGVSARDNPKLAALVSELAEIAEQAKAESESAEDERDKRKVIVFSYFADTVEMITEHLATVTQEDEALKPYHNRVTSLTGSSGDLTQVVYGFAPKSTEAPTAQEDLYDILVCTDVMAEGANLQQARHIINYDLPWNPMRLVQRHGRIDRIGSPHTEVWIRCFFPDQQLDALLGLEARLHRKIKQAASSIGVEAEVLPGSQVTDVTFAETVKEIRSLRDQDATLFETAGEIGHAYSGEEYRQELREGFQDREIERLVRGLPWGSGSGMVRAGARPGYVFCAYVGDYQNPVFRYVEMKGDGDIEVTDDTLTCLSHAHAAPETERMLDEATHELAYTAWDAARRDIYASWEFAADPRNLQPKVPKTMRDAAALLREHPLPEIQQQEIDRVVDALEAPYANRIQKIVREAMRSLEDPGEQAKAVVEIVHELGLEPSPAPEPLPVIEVEDVHLVCWLAIVPETPPSSGAAHENS